MGITPEIATTTRSPQIASIDQLGGMIAEVRARAGDRADALEVCMSYPGEGMSRPTVDVQRHRETIAELERIGVTWVNIGAPAAEPAAVLDFLRAFGETYCGGS
jgi:hypothetical protein